MLTFLSYVQTFLTRTKREDDDRGATAVEYGLMVALIAIVIIVGVTAVGVNLLALFNEIAAELV
ncbi:pilus assembly protein Flp/PilA [Lentzea waywayandensis]|jgi:pilus assembly protein Flp/PilA|uniref:Pilus assembly protein Flp/PilA n=1 Tax=Lentzea waywayandensis TaxID=84724 RepID=A0A1I6FA01_9PSEU|nr:Flp family type IVb pilin [Lentzea waywayandensis]SFR26682.1 pilus assembly protein Flp/PilA [Lentzea waywayandensis]